MKKLVIIAIAIVLLVTAGYFLVIQLSSKKPSPQTAVEEKTPPERFTLPSSQAPAFNTNDNLDGALQDLEQLDQLEQF